MAGIGNVIYESEQQEKLREKDLKALLKMKELEEKFKKERDIIEIKTIFGKRIKYVKKYGK